MPQLLHGILLATIYEVDNLNNGCMFNLRPKKSGKGFLAQVKRLLRGRPQIVGSKVYATVDLDKATVGRTSMIENVQFFNPQWHESFHIYCAHYISVIIFTVKEVNPAGETLIGRAYVPIDGFISEGSVLDKWIRILGETDKPIRSKIHVKLQFLNATQDSHWSRGISSSQFEGVPYTFFKQRQGCKVTLYQDAHVSYDKVRDLTLCDKLNLQNSERKRCWEDIFDAISNAKHFIYITGWSMYAKITLVMDQNTPKQGSNITLGELLKKKVEEGVTVLMLVWDDRNSVRELKKDGLMETHNQETEEYFRNTNVKCFLVPRNPEDRATSTVKRYQISTMFTHHQMTVVVDSEVPSGGSVKQRIVSFVGGIDLCDGRYDTPEHTLFKTLKTTHRDDFCQPNFAGSSIMKGGPREPWHDIHCKLEGPVAWDVLHNFEQRWKKQVGDKFLIPSFKLDELVIPPSPIISPNDTETWNVQLFRSIDGGDVFGFPENPEDVAALGLVYGKDNIIDRSIQDAYINAIRRAKNFVYIENQYFLGSSFSWKPNGIMVENIGALNLIPKELSLKIVSKIEAGERFAVYIVIPMCPEGIPESVSVQAILDWQRRTMEMMYSDIFQALQRKGLRANPRDYLNFFCLGNREQGIDESAPTETPQPDTDYSQAQEVRHSMIYVHAKMMIVDDEYIIIGSANINQRSMDGARDSEIAMGAFQPCHLATSHPARGEIYQFRMLLWYEHLGMFHEAFRHPESLFCVKVVNENAHKDWENYSRKSTVGEVIMCHAHLLRYPIELTSNGEITTMPGFEFFPDTTARVLGAKSNTLPAIFTT